MNAFRKPRRKAVVRNLIAELDPLNDAFRHHVLYGEEDGDRGGHAFSSTRIGKTVFPERWSEGEIFDAIRSVLVQPDRTKETQLMIILQSVIDDVLVEVKLHKSNRGYRLWAAFPRNGRGVFLNSHIGRIELPLELPERRA